MYSNMLGDEETLNSALAVAGSDYRAPTPMAAQPAQMAQPAPMAAPAPQAAPMAQPSPPPMAPISAPAPVAQATDSEVPGVDMRPPDTTGQAGRKDEPDSNVFKTILSIFGLG